MQSFFSKPLSHILKLSPYELSSFTKEIMLSSSVLEIERNIKLFDYLHKEMKSHFQRDKCDICYLFSFFSFHLVNKAHENFFSRLFLSYANLFYEHQFYSRSFSVCVLFLNYQKSNVVFSLKECNQEYNSQIQNYENNLSEVLSRIDLSVFSLTDTSRTFFMLYMSNAVQINSRKKLEAIVKFMCNNTVEIRNKILTDSEHCNYFEFYFKYLIKVFSQGIGILNEIENNYSNLISLLSVFCIEVIDNFLPDCKERINIKYVLNFLISIIIKFQNYFTTHTIKESNKEFNVLIERIVNYFNRFVLPNAEDKNLFKTYSHLLGKIENIYSILNETDNFNKYTLAILNFYKTYKIITVDLLLVKVNMYKSFIHGRYNKSQRGDDRTFFTANKENITDIFVLFNNCYLEDKEEKENFINISMYFNALLEFMILSEIQTKEKICDFNSFYSLIENIFTLYTKKCSNNNLLIEDKKFKALMYLLEILIEKNNRATLSRMIELFADNEKKLEKYFFIIVFFYVYQKKNDAILDMMTQLSEMSSDIKNFISFVTKIAFFTVKYNCRDKNFILNIMQKLSSYFNSHLTQSGYDSVCTTLDHFLFPHLTKLIISIVSDDIESKEQNFSLIFSFLQDVTKYTDEILTSFSFISKDSSFYTNCDLCNYIYYIIFFLIEKIIPIQVNMLNRETVSSLIRKDSVGMKVVCNVIFSLVKLKYKDEEYDTSFKEFCDSNELLKILKDDTNSVEKNNCFYENNSLLYYKYSKEMLSQFQKYISTISQQKIDINSKITLLHSFLLLSENFKYSMLFNNFEIFTKININLLSNAIVYLAKHSNEDNKLLLSTLHLISVTLKKENSIDFDYENILNHYDTILATPKVTYIQTLERLILTKLFIKFLLTYEDNLTVKSTMSYVKMKHLIEKSMTELSQRKKQGLDIYDYINKVDQDFFYFISDEQKETNRTFEIIEKGNAVLAEMFLLYRTLKKKKRVKSLSEIEKIRIQLIKYFFNSTTLKANANLLLLFNFDYESIVLDLISKIAAISKILFKLMFSFGFCDLILRNIHMFNQCPHLAYDKVFYNSLIVYLIKATRKYERKNVYNISPNDHYDFSSLSDFKTWENDLFILYIRRTYPELSINGYNSVLDIIKDFKIVTNDMLNKYLSIPYKYEIFENKKQIATYIKNSLTKESNIIAEFERLYNINEKNAITFYFSKFTDIQFKHEIKLIPYVFYDSFYNSLLNQPAIATIMTVAKAILSHEISWSEYKKIKHIKKIIKELIYFASVSDDEDLTKELSSFYVRNLHNFKYNFDFKGEINSGEIEKRRNNINIIATFRIKSYLYLYIEYKATFKEYNKIDLSKENIVTILNEVTKSLSKLSAYKTKCKSNEIDLIDQNLERNFFALQRELITSNKNIINVLSKFIEDNDDFNAYLDKKIKKYRSFHLSKKDMISWLFEQHNIELLRNDNKRPVKKTKSKKGYANNNNISIKELKNKFIRKIFLSFKPLKFSFYNKDNFFFYIPSGELSQIPFENLPLLFNFPIIRTNSYSYTYQLSTPRQINLSPKDFFYLLNPAKNLPESEKFLFPFFERNNITGIKSIEPKEQELLDALSNKKIFIYIGHGDGTKYLQWKYIKENNINFLTFLFGCSSANVMNITGRDTQPFGLPHYYLMSGCPFFLGFLWTVTSKDLDALLIDVFDLMLNRPKSSLIECVLKAKRFMKKRFLNGAALTLYSNNDIAISYYKE